MRIATVLVSLAAALAVAGCADPAPATSVEGPLEGCPDPGAGTTIGGFAGAEPTLPRLPSAGWC